MLTAKFSSSTLLAILVVTMTNISASMAFTLHRNRPMFGYWSKMGRYNSLTHGDSDGDFCSPQFDEISMYDDMYHRAVECVDNYGMCDLDEMIDLGRELEEYQGCFVEYGPEACEEEIEDRRELANALFLQSDMELKHQLEYERMQTGIENGSVNHRAFGTSNDGRMFANGGYNGVSNGMEGSLYHDRAGFIDV